MNRGLPTVDSAIDTLFDQVDSAFMKGDFESVNTLLEKADVGEWTTDMLIALLSITLSAKEHLPVRTEFVSRVENHLRETMKEPPSRVERLLWGLR